MFIQLCTPIVSVNFSLDHILHQNLNRFQGSINMENFENMDNIGKSKKKEMYENNDVNRDRG